jgi:hypothetical protein
MRNDSMVSTLIGRRDMDAHMQCATNLEGQSRLYVLLLLVSLHLLRRGGMSTLLLTTMKLTRHSIASLL